MIGDLPTNEVVLVSYPPTHHHSSCLISRQSGHVCWCLVGQHFTIAIKSHRGLFLSHTPLPMRISSRKCKNDRCYLVGLQSLTEPKNSPGLHLSHVLPTTCRRKAKTFLGLLSGLGRSVGWVCNLKQPFSTSPLTPCSTAHQKKQRISSRNSWPIQGKMSLVVRSRCNAIQWALPPPLFQVTFFVFASGLLACPSAPPSLRSLTSTRSY